MRPPRLAALTFGFLALACSPVPDPNTGKDGGASADSRSDQVHPDTGSPDTGSPDTATSGCSSLSECECLAANSCSVVSTGCWCPYPKCDSAGACICGGGTFIGCVKAQPGCTAPSCKLLDRLVGPSETGCYSCLAQTECNAARDALKTRCGTGEVMLEGLTCDKNAACVLACLNKVQACSEADCNFCLACDCVAVATPLSTCYAQCQQ